MKKLIVLILSGILIPMSLWAQKESVNVVNATKNLVVVEGVSIKARSSKDVSIDVNTKDAIASFEASYFEALEKKGPFNLRRSVDNRGRIILRDLTTPEVISEGSSSFFSKKNKVKVTETKTETKIVEPPKTVVNNYSGGDWSVYVDVRPENKLKGYSIFVPSEPFKGLALKSGQASSKTGKLKTGEIVFPVFLVAENDSVSNQGINFSWALVNKIVTEGEETFTFLPQDIMKANAGETIRKTFVSKLPFDFIISEGASRGIVIPSNYPRKMELYIGWNIIPIQYKDSNGLPTQAILILLVNDLKKPLMARGGRKTDEISVNRDNIVVTNWSR